MVMRTATKDGSGAEVVECGLQQQQQAINAHAEASAEKATFNAFDSLKAWTDIAPRNKEEGTRCQEFAAPIFKLAKYLTR